MTEEKERLSALLNKNLVFQDGIWKSETNHTVSYPDDGNNLCFEIEDNSFWFKHRNKLILELVHRFSRKSLFFDVGGGNGFVSKALQNAGVETFLVETGWQGIANAHKRGVNNLIWAPLDDLEFLAHSVPAIGVFDVVEHIENDLNFLGKLNEMITAWGHLYLTVPAYKALWSDEDVLAGHFHRYTLGAIEKKLELAGFKVVYSTYVFHFLPIPIFIMRSLPNKLNHRATKVDELKHKANHNKNSWIVEKLLNLELAAVTRGIRIPFGSSCLVVAIKN